MKDGHPWRWMITKFILRTAVAVSLCGSVYAVWDQYQTGSAEDRDGESDFWEKDDHAAEDRMPEPAADAQQVLKAERETMVKRINPTVLRTACCLTGNRRYFIRLRY